jgi:glycosyltransferase involved in cell wall biosynthesis
MERLKVSFEEKCSRSFLHVFLSLSDDFCLGASLITFVRMQQGNTISIVTIAFNNLEELKTTIAHIDAQSVKPLEHLIINGSNKEDIKRWLSSSHQPSYRKWISEPDEGISDAFNKGISMSRGDIIHLQNSGDYYFNEQVLRSVAAAFAANSEAQWLHGEYMQYRGGRWVIAGKPFDPRLLYRGMRTTGHPTMFVRREMYEKHGKFSNERRIAMDYDFLVRIAYEPFIFLSEPLVVFTPGGVSNRRFDASLEEVRQIYESRYGFSLKARLWSVRTLLLHKLTETGPGKRLYAMLKKTGNPQ